MRYTIRRHPAVEDDLFETVSMISDYAGIAVGLAKTDEIVNFIASLADFPKIGTVRDEIYTGLRAIPASEKAVVCFTVDDPTRTILIVCISYAGADWVSRVRHRR
ncbi:type II toxin-antitoxin system RelE/ParE family toxin [Rhizobium sp. VS19-DR104.2]|uniref:type II toxin-antitoxin system RelE/ParE family toxin n=1 Tax=unclassified Rhizobium TaxID=2613769 RepID=UPI001C5BDAF5|nr:MULTISPECIES: type II toxin-antitoxin system RelE/ParE family toxin [unclassified Rhizobium]MBZ5761007.1 type II toxin-antitoxin system RelE/ParE family toxin [Rhizobium sp. VS19-DR96]MBZ5767305.1 type II toxin-antitoxin system RelE/ParE family toxin [Rhizobium sp. VS19-DR129.2]MBZ5773406.1 type II toxin-antitoxin system RelE/ParE family toxin [Rhizobium sp. VS19-DRK62.2]MBZ5785617.1 type II toxin-antitoxin system RelE/ParE family toxin [Rhizobium sp. VS19-DR121]MBZ5805256.1 type II toxin-a